MSMYTSDGKPFEPLSRGSAFESYLASLGHGAFPVVVRRHTNGKSLVWYGDSLGAYAGGDGRTGEGFLSQINRYLGMEMDNRGYAGSNWTSAGAGDCPTRIQQLLDEGGEYDVVLLAWGTNGDRKIKLDDQGNPVKDANGNPIMVDNFGTAQDAPAKDGSMCAVMKWAVQSIRSAYPHTGVGIVIPPPGSGGGCSEEKANLMIECCRSADMHVPYLDMWHEGYIVASSSINDGSNGLGYQDVHLSAAGRDRYASALMPFVERLCPVI